MMCRKPSANIVPQSLRMFIYGREKIIAHEENVICEKHVEGDFISASDLAMLRSRKQDNCRMLLKRSSKTQFHDDYRLYSRARIHGPLNLQDLAYDQYSTLFGISYNDMKSLYSHLLALPHETKISPPQLLALYFFRLRSGLSLRMLQAIVNIPKSSISRYLELIRNALKEKFLEENFGFDRPTISAHTRKLTRDLFAPHNRSAALLILDGPYFYVEKPQDIRGQKETYSMHKYRNLVKTMAISTTTGYIVDIVGSYKAT